MLGVCVGAVLSSRLRVDVATGRMTTDYISEWLAPFPFALGLFALALFAFLAATYLTLETREDDLRRAFRARALGAAVATGVLAFACLLIAREGAPRMHAGLAGRDWSPAFQIVTGVVAIGAIAALATWRFKLARVLAALQVTLVIAGWGFSQFPYLVEPDLTIANSAAPPRVLRAVLWALAAGALLLLPALAFLYRLFKGGPPEPTGAE
jgi:cytochrome d ubiquinol oxidase subunit II